MATLEPDPVPEPVIEQSDLVVIQLEAEVPGRMRLVCPHDITYPVEWEVAGVARRLVIPHLKV